jgi:hypothetical protein
MVRCQKEEKEKLDRIERDIAGSLELTSVAQVNDTQEFEELTNKEFN